MLLEYFCPEAFKQLARLQAEQDGHLKELAFMESEASPSSREVSDIDEPSSRTASPVISSSVEESSGVGKKVPDGELDDSLKVWFADPWFKEWLMSKPLLASYDLRPYFFFSRDKLEALVGTVRRLSPTAREILTNITSGSDVLRRQAAERASSISEAEAVSVFSALVDQAKQQENLSDEKSVLYSIFDLVEVRPELCSQLVAVLGQLAESALSAGHVPRLIGVTKDKPAYGATLNLIERWSKITVNSALAAAAKNQVKRLK